MIICYYLPVMLLIRIMFVINKNMTITSIFNKGVEISFYRYLFCFLSTLGSHSSSWASLHSSSARTLCWRSPTSSKRSLLRRRLRRRTWGWTRRWTRTWRWSWWTRFRRWIRKIRFRFAFLLWAKNMKANL